MDYKRNRILSRRGAVNSLATDFQCSRQTVSKALEGSKVSTILAHNIRAEALRRGCLEVTPPKTNTNKK